MLWTYTNSKFIMVKFTNLFITYNSSVKYLKVGINADHYFFIIILIFYIFTFLPNLVQTFEKTLFVNFSHSFYLT